MNRILRFSLYTLLATIIFLIDRITKIEAFRWCINPWKINHYLSFDFVLNRGISWGFFHSDSLVIFWMITTIIGIITLAIAIYGIRQFLRGNSVVGPVLIVAGSTSNLIDRFYYNGVIDFILLSYKNYSWPLFNVADIAIVSGIFLMCIVGYKS